jgi:iron(III) transport system ATP-binding protein
VRIVSGGGTGLHARVTGTMYQGGYFRVDANIAAQADVALHFTVAEPTTVAAGADIHVAVDDGWIIPRPASS